MVLPQVRWVGKGGWFMAIAIAEEFKEDVPIMFLFPYFLFASNVGDGDAELYQLSLQPLLGNSPSEAKL